MTTFTIVDFTSAEFAAVMRKATGLIRKGCITAINFLQAGQSLPESSVIVHFLHNSKEHISSMEPRLISEYVVVPRKTVYPLKPEYFSKPSFREEYADADFFDSSFRQISLGDAVRNPLGVSVCNNEFDLLFPVAEPVNLPEVIRRIRSANDLGPDPWLDPVIIIKTERGLEPIPSFFISYMAMIRRASEAFYTVIPDDRRRLFLDRYLDTLCASTKIGRLERTDVVINQSQINEEFFRYIIAMQKPLEEFP